MGLDIRTPIGLMFLIFGALLTGFGLTSDKAIYARSLGININLWWGLVMFAFGAVMFLLAWFGRSAAKSSRSSVEGSATEEREHRLGLEDDRPRHGH